MSDHIFQLPDHVQKQVKLFGMGGGTTNPCVRYYGTGPEGIKCKTCSHLFRKRYSKTYIKCDLRMNTNGKGSDHKANWPACSKYEEADQAPTIRPNASSENDPSKI